ncbi:MAG: flavodoxin domain-containing protein [Candidatus Methanoperedens sp.]|nr:flavodoxin domain-containing protein [Candidatus Methanoperedens sp.]MCZ7371642.1 flavodoxin domain-containing protein [Candidatus Methanoperedens sp.]
MAKVAIIYDSATHNTEAMAKAIAEGIKSEKVDVNLSHVHEAKIEDIRNVDGVVLGSGTYHHEIMPALEVFLDQAKDVGLKGKVGAAFCSYGWSPEVVDLITNRLKGYGMETLEGLLIHEKPDEAGLEKCREFGKRIAMKVKGR